MNIRPFKSIESDSVGQMAYDALHERAVGRLRELTGRGKAIVVIILVAQCIDVKKRSNKNLKTLKNVKNVTKIKSVCKR